ncbi:MAG: hypothetical protein QXT45_04315 [Candidatus Bilamarchaeaceae archaeon]
MQYLVKFWSKEDELPDLVEVGWPKEVIVVTPDEPTPKIPDGFILMSEDEYNSLVTEVGQKLKLRQRQIVEELKTKGPEKIQVPNEEQIKNWLLGLSFNNVPVTIDGVRIRVDLVQVFRQFGVEGLAYTIKHIDEEFLNETLTRDKIFAMVQNLL